MIEGVSEEELKLRVYLLFTFHFYTQILFH